jgi:hypothetical protein
MKVETLGSFLTRNQNISILSPRPTIPFHRLLENKKKHNFPLKLTQRRYDKCLFM